MNQRMNQTNSAALGYQLDVPGLGQAISECPPAPKHQQLVKAMQRFEPLANTRLAAQRGDAWLARCKVVDRDGTVVHDDHEAWLREQLQADGGQAAVTFERLKGAGYLLSRCAITTLYLIHDRGGQDQANFAQAVVDMEDEWTDRALFTHWPFRTPRDLKDLLDMPGQALQESARRQLGGPVYRLLRVVDVRAFVDAAEALERQRREAFRQRRYAVREGGGIKTLIPAAAGQPGRVLSADEAFPGWDAAPVKWGRMFADWMVSSAGRSGARLCEHWAMQLSDHTSPQGERWMSLVPLWTTTLKLAKVEGVKGSAYELFGKLEKIDHRIKVPFAWYFFMLHGNRVDDAAARRVIAAAEAGQIVLPEHDYRVLKAWEAHPYGF